MRVVKCMLLITSMISIYSCNENTVSHGNTIEYANLYWNNSATAKIRYGNLLMLSRFEKGEHEKGYIDTYIGNLHNVSINYSFLIVEPKCNLIVSINKQGDIEGTSSIDILHGTANHWAGGLEIMNGTSSWVYHNFKSIDTNRWYHVKINYDRPEIKVIMIDADKNDIFAIYEGKVSDKPGGRIVLHLDQRSWYKDNPCALYVSNLSIKVTP